jgi:signal transduction histidine kinase
MLAWCLHLLVIALLALTVIRAVADGNPRVAAVVVAAAICAAVYVAGPALPAVRRSSRNALVWLAVLGAAWVVVLAFSADGVWLAFPLYFLLLHLAPRRTGLVAVVLTAIVAIVGFAAHQGFFSVAIAIGPALGAAVAVAVVWGYQALYRESEQRRRLIGELTATRSDLATAQHAAGVAAERERLAREIHDTIAQGLSSIQLGNGEIDEDEGPLLAPGHRRSDGVLVHDRVLRRGRRDDDVGPRQRVLELVEPERVGAERRRGLDGARVRAVRDRDA